MNTKPDSAKTEGPKTDRPSSARKDELVDIADHPAVWRWMRDLARRDPEGFSRLSGPNLSRLQHLYGRPEWESSGDKAWTHAWGVHDHHLSWVIQSGPESTWIKLRVPAGTSHDYLSDPRVGVGATAFLQTLLRRFMGNLG